jgi:hypothetical protein
MTDFHHIHKIAKKNVIVLWKFNQAMHKFQEWEDTK